VRKRRGGNSKEEYENREEEKVHNWREKAIKYEQKYLN
jgi:hypothetical protein